MKQFIIALSIVGLINGNRVNPVVANERLNRVADCRAEFLHSLDIWSHLGWTWCFRINGVYGGIGEVLSKDFDKNEHVVNAWMNSPSHKNVITNESYTKVGTSQLYNYVIAVFQR